MGIGRFMKNKTIYKKGQIKIYINQCHAPRRKTNKYAVRRNDSTGLGAYLGSIYFHPAWKQYIFEPDNQTIWSEDCMQGIIDFIKKINEQWAKKVKARMAKR